ncbi:HD superfamily hydrolase (HD-GYP domain) [Candidatus Vampirococcus lugosii]|uniref:HD superfamily hydrolase (HD-GYP domain) n=1 Tax=Candidatus Vampirococcus lugosii TaxID=2789015 RepID=A0ABS5QMP1_9BACT|nr:HD superfamily hydrolase (HD-GYP domain) [Candidatus Vampirococcus lugosii]
MEVELKEDNHTNENSELDQNDENNSISEKDKQIFESDKNIEYIREIIIRNKYYYMLLDVASKIQYNLFCISTNLDLIDLDQLQENISSLKSEIDKLLGDIFKNIPLDLFNYLKTLCNTILKVYISGDLYDTLSDENKNVEGILGDILDEKSSIPKTSILVLSIIISLSFYIKQLYNELVNLSGMDFETYEIDLSSYKKIFDKKTIEVIKKIDTVESKNFLYLYKNVIDIKNKACFFNKLIIFNKTPKSNFEITKYLTSNISKLHPGGVEFFSFQKIMDNINKNGNINFANGIELMIKLIDVFDLTYSPGHSKRVSKLSNIILELLLDDENYHDKRNDEIQKNIEELELILDDEKFEGIEEIIDLSDNIENDFSKCIHLSTLLHDAGKLGTDLLVLSSRIKLNDEEFKEVRSHPGKGEELIKFFTGLENIPKFIYDATFHHERPDGKGYPLGNILEEIPLISRIIAVADIIDAMLGKRHYVFEEKSVKYVYDELIKASGKQLDAEIVDIITKNKDFFKKLYEIYKVNFWDAQIEAESSGLLMVDSLN